MGVRFEELDWQETPIGAISLRRRRDPVLDVDVFEVKLDDEYLMSSLFTVAEVELARLGLARLPGSDLDVVVGGLGLGYTARAALEDQRVRSLLVVEGLGEVIEWHERGLLPLAPELTGDARNRFLHGDFFALAESAEGFDDGREFDAILLDIDHSPQNVLDSGHTGFYAAEGLRKMAAHLRPGGVFALWSDDPPEDGFTRTLAEVFDDVTAHVVEFDNHYTGGKSANTVYVGTST